MERNDARSILCFLLGLDPAGPYFDNTAPEVRLDPTDATFVDVMHTDAQSFIHLPRLGRFLLLSLLKQRDVTWSVSNLLRIKVFIPPVYEVYRGYIVFVFSVTMFVCVYVCVCVNVFSVKDFSVTTEPRILKFSQTLGKTCCIV